MLQSFHIADRRLVEQILKRTTVVKTTAHLRHEFVGDVHSKTASLDPAVKNMAKVLFAFKASYAVLSDAPATAKTQRSQSSWPKAGNLFLKPIGNICGKFFLGWHVVYVTYIHIYSQAKFFNCFLCSNL
jgi:hypothetical protein